MAAFIAEKTEQLKTVNARKKLKTVGTRLSYLPDHDASGRQDQPGKGKARFNAIKHGIFAVGLVPRRESKAQYLRSVAGLFEALQPVGSLEEILVEKLANLMWRYRRLLQAEAAEIAEKTQAIEDDRDAQDLNEMTRARMTILDGGGLLPEFLRGGNKMALLMALGKLEELRKRIRKYSLNWDRDLSDLILLFGSENEEDEEGEVIEVPKTKGVNELVMADRLVRTYRELTIAVPELGRSRPSQVDAANQIVKFLDEMIGMYKRAVEYGTSRRHDQNQRHTARALVPNQEAIDRLLRYEASLERSFDRTLSQLERLQRFRLGQPLLPALKVDVSH